MDVFIYPWVTSTGCLAILLIVSGAAKIKAPHALDAAFRDLRVPRILAVRPLRRALPWAEIALGILLLSVPVPVFPVVCWAVLALMVVYLVLICRAALAEEPVSCACFGEAQSGVVDRWTVLRNVVLVLAAAFTALGASALPVHAWWAADGRTTEAWLAALPVVLIGGAVWNDLGGGRGAPAAVAAPGSGRGAGATSSALDADDGEYVREPTPRALLSTGPGAGAGRTSLRALTRSAPALLIRVSEGCGGCWTLLAEWDRIVADVGPRVPVYAVLRGEFPDGHGGLEAAPSAAVLYDPSGDLDAVFDTNATPWAVLLGVDGLLAGGPEVGATNIREMVAEIRQQMQEPSAA